MDNKKGSNIINAHLKVKTIDDLADYLTNMIPESYYFEVLKREKTMIAGHLGETAFYIYFIPAENEPRALLRLTANVDDGYEDSDYLEKKLAPIMWGYSGTDNERLYGAKIVSYEESFLGTNKTTIWDTCAPEATLDMLVNGSEEDFARMSEFEIFYPGITLEELKKKYYYGNFPGDIPKERVEAIKNMSEFEIFYSLRCLDEMYDKLENGGEVKLTEDIGTNLDYVLSFLFAQTKKFGVKEQPPTKKYVDPNEEQFAWYSMWTDAFEEALEENPNLMEDWAKEFECGYDPNFRPKEDFKTYFKRFMQECIEEEEKYLKELDETNREKLIEILKHVRDKKMQVEAKEKTLVGRTENLFNEVLAGGNSVTKESGEEPSPDINYFGLNKDE